MKPTCLALALFTFAAAASAETVALFAPRSLWPGQGAYYTVEKGLAGREPGSPPAFVAMCAPMQQHGAEVMAEIAKYH